jgi:hypothetical protein
VEKGNVKKWLFSSEERTVGWQMLEEKRKRKTRDGLGIPGRIAEPTGTDGFRLLCHQFFLSCLLLPENCLTSSTIFSLKRNKRSEALLLFYDIAGQGRETRQMGDPLQHGRRCCTVFLKGRNLCETWLRMRVSRMKQDGVCCSCCSLRLQGLCENRSAKEPAQQLTGSRGSSSGPPLDNVVNDSQYLTRRVSMLGLVSVLTLPG